MSLIQGKLKLKIQEFEGVLICKLDACGALFMGFTILVFSFTLTGEPASVVFYD
jgi:hypothetical protein